MTNVLSQTLSGKVALTTGAGGRIGRSICAALSAAGARVIATDIIGSSPSASEDLQMEHDVTSASSWANVVDEVRAKFGRLDCLVNAAGICTFERIENLSIDQWRREVSVNVESILLGLQATLPLLRESGKDIVGGSSVVNISSAAGLRGFPFAAAYCASKGAVTLLSKSAAKEFAALGYPIRVNSVHPGSVDSTMMDVNIKRFVELGAAPSVEAARTIFTSVPMRRLAKAEEIAGAIVFLCSPASSYMTGSEVVIDGGAIA